MDSEGKGTQNDTFSCKTKVPMDVRIVAYLLYAFGFIQLTVAALLITGIGRTEYVETRRVLFGTVLFSTSSVWAIYMLCTGLAHVLAAWALIRKLKFGWWFALLYSIYYLIEDAFWFPENELMALIGIIISICIITWLCFRRHAYGIGLGAWRRRKAKGERHRGQPLKYK